ncbi:MAG: hypothetical protein KDC38_20890 [Planctomycetes bacterium]|nr:hypothetical protein [Planctomycetota bacterium]
MTRFVGLALISLLGLTTAGCASYRPKDPPEVRNLPNSRLFGEFSVGAEVPRDDVEVRTYFDRDLLSCGVLPVHVYLRSTDDEADYEIDPRTVHLSYADGTELRQISARDAYERCRFSHFRALPGYLFIFPIFISHPVIAGANGRMEEDFIKKQLRSQRLIRKTDPAREGVVGVLYFAAPDSDDDLDVDKVLNGGSLSMDVVRYQTDTPDPAQTLRILFSN